ncbi:hypothetical protein BaRGS_00030487 [Batillaria attramentaria]|uniref:Uncharacterized protein n=1 Tax=Batillaria attramentaria TaxID=370345 RepID=A0ABD0JU60_9CAEN
MAGQTLSGYYMKLLEAAIGFGATSSKQRNATSELVECLHNTHGTVVLDKAIKLMVEKVIETGSWSFLVEVFYAGDKGRIGQRVVNMLMVVSAEEKRVILLFLKALYAMTDALDMDNMDFVINSEFYFLMCILESEAVDAQTKADCIQEFFSVRCESVPALIIPEVQQAIYCQFVLTSSEIKNVLYRMGSEHQVALIKALQAKTDTECQNLALIFATLLDRWDLAGDAEKKSITGKPALFVFDLAWSARALKYAASFLQKFMDSGHDTLEAELTVTCKRVTRDFSREKQNTENLLSQCLAECRCNRLFSAGALFALCAGDRKEVQRMVARAAESEKGRKLEDCD